MRLHPICRIFLPALVAPTILFGASCSPERKGVTVAPADPVDQAVSHLLECLPPSSTDDGTAAVKLPRLAISKVSRLPNQTRVEIVAWAQDEPALLTLPLYLRSGGRWILGENERVYLVDQDCRTYALNDVEFRLPRTSPGVIPIRANQAIHGVLLFPPLGPRAHIGALIYGPRSLPTLLFPPQAGGNTNDGERKS